MKTLCRTNVGIIWAPLEVVVAFMLGREILEVVQFLGPLKYSFGGLLARDELEKVALKPGHFYIYNLRHDLLYKTFAQNFCTS